MIVLPAFPEAVEGFIDVIHRLLMSKGLAFTGGRMVGLPGIH
jgi:hypothetical protein